jgi:cathepsin D
MFRKSSVVVAIALSILASAVPHVPEHGGKEGIRIPLRKRATFVKSDGTFDMEKAIAHTVAVHNKHRQNLINLERNVGREAFNPVSRRFLPSPHVDSSSLFVSS